jgi:hypothetical protein
MNCHDARAARFARDLNSEAEAHLAACARCRARSEEIRRVSDELDDPALWEEPGPDADSMVLAMLGGGPSSPASRRSGVWWMTGAAAAVVLVAGIGGLLLGQRHPADWTAVVIGSESAPDASGVVRGWNMASGTRVVLESRGLAPAPPGHHYEFWFIGDGMAFSGGTFLDPARVELLVAVPRRDFPTLLVTLEPTDGDPTPSDVWVLASED